MTRWHNIECISPDVFVDEDNRPMCRACAKKCPTTPSLIADSKDTIAGITLPSDEIYGEMNLWWPKDVLYVNQRDIALQPTKKDEDKSSKQSEGQETLQEQNRKSEIDSFQIKQSISHVYPKKLKSDEFRLACLSAVHKQDYPVHLDIETYTYNNRPEYETVSYMWGGETGDSRPRQPIFVGPYWDVLLQSQNCWRMLKFMRPWRGIRMVWIDALCINQIDLEERAMQVARMRQIYGDGNRVVVYIGEDVVSTDTNHFPAYVNIDSFDSLPPYEQPVTYPNQTIEIDSLPQRMEPLRATNNLQRLLNRRYFSRVWVIQELIASESALIRVGHTDFRADASSMSRITKGRSESYNWGATKAPWLQFLGRKAINLARLTDIVSLAAMTSNSRATDPRDRIFAIVQLLTIPRLRETLAPDYTISFQHFSIGFFAHALLVANRYSFLDHAGLAHSSCMPTWVPQCRTHSAWERTLSNAIIRNYDVSPYENIPTHSCQVYLDEYGFITLRELVSDFHYAPSYIKPAVDAATGSILMDLTHLFEFHKHPLFVRSYHGLCFYEVNQQTEDSRALPLLFMAWNELKIEIGDHLFVLPMEDEQPNPFQHGDRYDNGRYMYLVLRPKQTDDGLRTYSLVTTRLAICAQSVHSWPSSVLFSGSDWPGLRNISFLRLSEVQSSVASAVTSILNILVEAKREIFTQEQHPFLSGLPTDHGPRSRMKASAICGAFYKDDCKERNEDIWGHLGSVLIHPTYQQTLLKKCVPMVNAMRDFLTRNHVKLLIDTLMDSYTPGLMLEELMEIIAAWPTDEQRQTGIPKYINGTKVDGSIMRVLIA